MADFVWMTHPTLPGQPVRVPEYGFSNYWEGQGWVIAEAPFPEAALADEYMSPRELELRLDVQRQAIAGDVVATLGSEAFASRATQDEVEGRLSEANLSATMGTEIAAQGVPKWKPSTAYAAGAVVMAPDGSIVKRVTAGTSGPTFTSTNWTSVNTFAGTQARAELESAFAIVAPGPRSPRDYGLRDYNRSEGTVISDMNTVAEWTVGGVGTRAEDTTYYRSGGKAVRLAVTTAGSNANISKTVSLNFGGSAPALRVWVYLHDANCAGIQFFLTSDGTFTKYFMYLTDFPPMQVGAWNLVTVPLSRWTNIGGESWNNTMTIARLRANAKPGTTTTVTFDDFSYNPSSDPRVLFTFDDADVTVYRTAYPIMRKRGLPGVVYVNGSTIGTEGYMTLDQCKELYAAGWDIASHGYAHMIYTGKTQAEVQADIEQNRDWLIANGFKRSANHFAIPNSLYSENVRAAAQAAGVLTMRRGQHSLMDPSSDLLDFPSVVIQNTTTVAQIKGFLDNAHKGRGTAFLMFHTIKDPAADEYHYSVANFQAVVDYIYEQVWEDSVVTASRWWRCLNRP